MKRKTIAFMTYSLASGGAERVLTTLANEFCDTYNVVIISLTDCVSFYPLNAKIKCLSCGLDTNDNKSGFYRLGQYFKTLRKIRKSVSENHIDLIVGFLTVVNIYALLAARTSGIPCIISERNNPEFSNPGTLWKLLRKLTYRFADNLVVQTQANAVFYRSFIQKTRIKVVPNPLSRNLTEKRSPTQLTNENLNILTVGRLDRNKAHELLLRAFSKIDSEKWLVRILGDGPLLASLKQLAEDLQIGDKVLFLGNRKEVWEFYNSATIFAFTSRSEGFPNVLLEALYFGIPSISTDCPHGPSDLIQNGENGLLIPVDDQEALEQGLERLMTDFKLRKKLSENAATRAAEYETDKIKALWQVHINALIAAN